MNSRRAITLLGIGDDGCASLTSRAVDAVMKAGVLVGGERQLEFFPQFQGERIVLREGLSSVLDRVAELAEEQNVCVVLRRSSVFQYRQFGPQAVGRRACRDSTAAEFDAMGFCPRRSEVGRRSVSFLAWPLVHGIPHQAQGPGQGRDPY